MNYNVVDVLIQWYNQEIYRCEMNGKSGKDHNDILCSVAIVVMHRQSASEMMQFICSRDNEQV